MSLAKNILVSPGCLTFSTFGENSAEPSLASSPFLPFDLIDPPQADAQSMSSTTLYQRTLVPTRARSLHQRLFGLSLRQRIKSSILRLITCLSFEAKSSSVWVYSRI